MAHWAQNTDIAVGAAPTGEQDDTDADHDAAMDSGPADISYAAHGDWTRQAKQWWSEQPGWPEQVWMSRPTG